MSHMRVNAEIYGPLSDSYIMSSMMRSAENTRSANQAEGFGLGVRARD